MAAEQRNVFGTVTLKVTIEMPVDLDLGTTAEFIEILSRPQTQKKIVKYVEGNLKLDGGGETFGFTSDGNRSVGEPGIGLEDVTVDAASFTYKVVEED